MQSFFSSCLLIRITTTSLAFIIAMPIFVISLSWFTETYTLWLHFQNTILSSLFSNTIILLLGVGFGVAILGTVLAWFVTMTEFPGRRYLEWALLLPFAIPAYVLAFVYLGIFDYAGFLQVWLRATFAVSGFDIRSGYFAPILTFVLVFYPYVYMISRASFKRQQASVIASARLLNAGAWRVFWQISVPLARPAIIAGVLITMMETLADFGVVSLFNYDTFTTAIYSAWSDFRSVSLAAQLATVLVFMAFLLMYLERISRGKTKYYGSDIVKHKHYILTGYKAWCVCIFVFSVVLFSFLIPMIQLLIWAWQTLSLGWDSAYISLLINTISLSMIATAVIIAVASILAFPNECLRAYRFSVLSVRIATLGYAIPGSVMAVGLLYGVTYISSVSHYLFNISLTHYLFGSIALLIFAYTSRFIAIAYNAIDASAQQIKPTLIESAQLLGAGKWRIASRIEFPIMTPGILAACLLVAIDVMKELPATYLLRPFGWNTLAIKTYELSIEGLNEAAALPALLIVLLALSIIVLFLRFDRSSHRIL